MKADIHYPDSGNWMPVWDHWLPEWITERKVLSRDKP